MLDDGSRGKGAKGCIAGRSIARPAQLWSLGTVNGQAQTENVWNTPHVEVVVKIVKAILVFQNQTHSVRGLLLTPSAEMVIVPVYGEGEVLLCARPITSTDTVSVPGVVPLVWLPPFTNNQLTPAGVVTEAVAVKFNATLLLASTVKVCVAGPSSGMPAAGNWWKKPSEIGSTNSEGVCASPLSGVRKSIANPFRTMRCQSKEKQ